MPRRRLAALTLETLVDLRVFRVRLDLLHFERNPQTLREIAFRHREITRARVPRIEMLVVPEIRRRHDGAFLPFKLHQVSALEALFAEQREAAAVECED